MSIDEYITRFTAAAEFERKIGKEQGYEEFKHLAEWLKDYKRLLEQEPKYCERNICLRNEYYNIGCDECEVTKSQTDAVSRQAVLDYLKANVDDFLDYHEAIEKVLQMPSVKPQEPIDENLHREREQAYMQGYEDASKKCRQEPTKTGHWIKVSDGYGDNAYICECSECKDTVWVYKDADRKWNFCPNCGARMVEMGKPQESEEV